jgi:glutathione S-transferase
LGAVIVARPWRNRAGAAEHDGQAGDRVCCYAMKLTLYHFWRSSASWRVRWALAIKGLPFESVPVDLLAGEQKSEEHRARNPIGHVPALGFEDGRILAESVAILEYLDDLVPEPALYPRDPWKRARVRQLVETINAGVQPLASVAVPAGLYFERAARASCVKKSFPSHRRGRHLRAQQARRHLRLGRGVLRRDAGQLRGAPTPRAMRAIRGVRYWGDIETHTAAGGALDGPRLLRLSRKTLLQILHERCRELGVTLHFQHERRRDASRTRPDHRRRRRQQPDAQDATPSTSARTSTGASASSRGSARPSR